MVAAVPVAIASCWQEQELSEARGQGSSCCFDSIVGEIMPDGFVKFGRTCIIIEVK
jgi:hypothetical protein